MTDKRRKQILDDLINWIYDGFGPQGIRDLIHAAGISKEEQKELELDDLLKEEDW